MGRPSCRQRGHGSIWVIQACSSLVPVCGQCSLPMLVPRCLCSTPSYPPRAFLALSMRQFAGPLGGELEGHPHHSPAHSLVPFSSLSMEPKEEVKLWLASLAQSLGFTKASPALSASQAALVESCCLFK